MLGAKAPSWGFWEWLIKKRTKKEKDPFSDSSEIFESIFKEASHEIQSETENVARKTRFKAEAQTRDQT